MPVPSTRILTNSSVPGREITESLGIVGAECVLGVNVVRDIMANIRDFVGGRSGTYQNALREGRETCLTELADAADALGADAVVSVRFDYSTIGRGGMILLAAWGTAVKLR